MENENNEMNSPEALELLSSIKSICPNSWAICTDGSVETLEELRETLAALQASE
jgi:hypothetical protein